MEPCARDGDDGFEVLFEFFVACSEAPEVLEFGEAPLDAVALSVEVFVVGVLVPAAGQGGYDRYGAHRCDVSADRLAVVAFVGHHPLGLALSEQRDGLGAVVDLATGDREVHRQTQFLCQQMNLGRQTSSGAPQSLVGAPLLRPVAAC